MVIKVNPGLHYADIPQPCCSKRFEYPTFLAFSESNNAEESFCNIYLWVLLGEYL